jgi:hypothetical protein
VLSGRGVRIELHEMAKLDLGTILHWDLNHFVVLEGVDKRGIRIVDPALGRRRADWNEVGRSFSGVALILERTDRFTARGEAQKKQGRPVYRYLRRILADSRLWPRIVVSSILLQVFAIVLVIALVAATVAGTRAPAASEAAALPPIPAGLTALESNAEDLVDDALGHDRARVIATANALSASAGPANGKTLLAAGVPARQIALVRARVARVARACSG